MPPEPVEGALRLRQAQPADQVPLAEHTTLRVGGPARRVIVVDSEADVIEVVGDLDAAGEPVLILGEGSNVLIGDDGFAGTVVKIATRGIDEDLAACSGAVITVAAGEPWDPLVAYAVSREWAGLEAMSGIPGLVGATPIQNVGAYGAEVGQLISLVRTFDRATRRIKTFFPVECGFGYRSSRFKHPPLVEQPGRYVILSVTFQLRLGAWSAPVRYPELARALGIEIGDRALATAVREAVLALRTGKGMVLDPGDHDTWSAGSFFTNPIVSASTAGRLPATAPRFPQPDGMVKTSAAWLIASAGFGRGYGGGAARLSGKHALALTNRGDAGAAEVRGRPGETGAGGGGNLGIPRVREPILGGCAL